MKWQLLSQKARSCCCLGFRAQSEKVKTNVAGVGGWWENAWGNLTPRALQGLTDIPVWLMLVAGKETAGLHLQAASACRKVVIFTQGRLTHLGLGLRCSYCTKNFVFDFLFLSLS